MSKVVRVLEPGAYTTVQDLGRFGYQRFGVPPCGVLDKFAAKCANLLLKNDENAAVLEMTFMGPTLEILAPCTLAVTGAAMTITVNGQPVEGWSSFPATSGDIVNLGSCEAGCRAYLAVNGGLDVPIIMGSRSCYTGGGFGGHEGRILERGDILDNLDETDKTIGRRRIPPVYVPTYTSSWTLRAIPGPQDDWFDEGMELFFTREFSVTHQANRMGYRLQGPKIIRKQSMPASIISEPSLPGGVQVPEGGDPIILLSEQTVGGYAKIATVIGEDIARVAQAMPGDTIRFKEISIRQAHDIQRQRNELYRLLEKEKLSLQSFAVHGKEYYNSEVFREKVYRAMRQI